MSSKPGLETAGFFQVLICRALGLRGLGHFRFQGFGFLELVGFRVWALGLAFRAYQAEILRIFRAKYCLRLCMLKALANLRTWTGF